MNENMDYDLPEESNRDEWPYGAHPDSVAAQQTRGAQFLGLYPDEWKAKAVKGPPNQWSAKHHRQPYSLLLQDKELLAAECRRLRYQLETETWWRVRFMYFSLFLTACLVGVLSVLWGRGR